MFTGLVETVGRLKKRYPQGGDFRLLVQADSRFMSDVKLGDSIAVNGVCLTVTSIEGPDFTADVSLETVAHSLIQLWKPGRKINLEKALTLATRLGGHLVTGHVDGVGTVKSKTVDARSWQFTIQAPDSLHRYLAKKGSITVDGVSLTINDEQNGLISLNIVPHTVQNTTLEDLNAGDSVHMEVDIVARYLEQLLRYAESPEATDSTERSTIDKSFLARFGFLKH